ncbi:MULTISPECIES: DUF1542 domain-containing protein [unclassified Streptococcus]|uniref:DUF1542 domain-containing protein n=1 Tax=unclassified Streptococcus TaxID=2608887 RepID=UPI001F044A22|nr:MULTISPECIES: DUF1542 domain-containing protein [unclassified Streptococcus]
MFKKKNDGNGEKIFRYSIRKYHFGAASVAVAALMFFANGVQAQAPAVSSATASDVVAGSAGNSDGEPQESDGEEPEKVSQTEPSAELKSTGESNSPETKIEDASKGQETAGLAPTKPETKPAAQETSQGGAVKEQDQPTSVTKTTEAKSLQGNLQALLEKLTLSSMKALHDEVESRLAAAKAVLDDPKATQAQVDEQVRLMEDLIRRVNQALKPSLPKLTDLGEASSTNNKLVEPNRTATEQATGGKRRKRGGLSQATPAVDQANPETVGNSEKTESSEKPSRQELPTYSNQGDGAYKLKDELEFIYKQLRKEGAEESKIQAAKAAADKFNEAFSKGDTISQEDFAAALVDLKKSRDLIEGVLEEKYGEETTAGGVTPQPRDGGYSDFRSANYSGRSARVARASENYSQDFLTARESYFERTDIKGHSPYDKYTYVFFSDRRPRDNSTAFVKGGYKYLNVTVKPTNNGFRWTIQINKDNHRTLPGHTEVWFTVPSGQTVKTNTVGISYYDRGGGGYAPPQDGRDLVEKLKRANIGLGDVTKGTISNSGLPKKFGPTVFPRRNLEDLARGRRYNANPYERQAESREAQAISNEKLENIKRDAAASLYYFQLPNSDRSYMLTFETEGNNDLGKLDYAAGFRGQDGHEVFLVNQWHSRTTTEFKEDALKQIEQARRDKNNSITGNRNLSEVEQRGATSKVDIYARRATSGINQAQNIGEVENSLQQGLSDIQNVNPVGKENALKAVDEAKKAKDQAITTNQSLSDAEKTEAKEAVKTAADQAKTKINNAGDQSTVDQAKSEGLQGIQNVNPVGKENALKAVDEAKKAKDQAITTNQSLSDAEKTEAKEAVKTAADQAKTKINNAGDQSTVDQAKNDGLSALDKILEDLSTRINQGNSSTPGNGANQAGSDSRGDTASQGDRPAPSDDGGQGDANNQDQPTTPSIPAHSGDSTDQATAPSAQDRETGNATAPESPQGLSGSSVTAPARSRRSVSFAGGTQSSQEKQVDKSVLRDLIQDLETRLKDLDGIDQSVIDAAKVILGEGQAALRNADLTEAGLREVTAKVKEALESLKGKQATKDEEETKETSKEQGHLPYGTMIGSLLALLGLLLFLIARRKKESELKKLTKELTKVLQESDLTNVDAKVLDQAREALTQAVAFLANEKESDHTEDELIEKLKAILAQLR